MSMEVILDTASLSLELVLFFEMLSFTAKSIRWLLCRILSGIIFEILLLSSLMVFQSTASIWSIGMSMTFSGVLFFGMSEAFSSMSSFAFVVPAKMICALTVYSKFEKITFLDGAFSIATV